MKNREKLKRLVIEAIHGLPYEEAIEKEYFTTLKEEMYMDGREETIEVDRWGFSITLPRVMQALDNKEIEFSLVNNGIIFTSAPQGITWKLIKENGQECADNEQTDECIDALIKLLS